MRVAYWTEFFWPYIGGVEVLSVKLLPELAARGCSFTVITTHGNVPLPDEDRFHGMPVHRFHFHEALSERNLETMAAIRRRVRSVLDSFAPDLVHFSGVGTGAFFHSAMGTEHTPALLVSLQQQMLPVGAQSPNSVVASMLRRADWVTGVSHAVLDEARALVPDITPRSSVIYNFVDTPAVAPAPLPFDPPRLLCLGRLVPQKGFDVALRAFADVRLRFPTARLVIAGDGAERPALERLSAELGLAESVEFLGWIQPAAVPDLLNRCTLVLMPSRYEGLPLVAVQAAWMARPIVATRVGGNAEVVLHEKTGLTIAPDDPAALAASVLRLLASPSAAHALGEAGREHARRVFNEGPCMDQYEALYRRLTKAKRAPCPEGAA